MAMTPINDSEVLFHWSELCEHLGGNCGIWEGGVAFGREVLAF